VGIPERHQPNYQQDFDIDKEINKELPEDDFIED
jgi:hypothetical protein